MQQILKLPLNEIKLMADNITLNLRIKLLILLKVAADFLIINKILHSVI